MRSHIRRHVGIGTVDYRLAGDALSVAGLALGLAADTRLLGKTARL